MDIYLSSAYLAPIQYYCKFLVSDRVFIEQNENYMKQSYRNRCSIMAANGIMNLSIPIEHSSGNKIQTKDIRISYHGNWQHLHWNAIISAYNSSPFFEYYQDDFHRFYHKEYSFLFDFNQELMMMILDLLYIDSSNIYFTEVYKTDFADEEIDLRDTIHPKKDYKSVDSFFFPQTYYQVFLNKYDFVPNMSIIDLLFNMGNESIIVLKKSVKPYLNQ